MPRATTSARTSSRSTAPTATTSSAAPPRRHLPRRRRQRRYPRRRRRRRPLRRRGRRPRLRRRGQRHRRGHQRRRHRRRRPGRRPDLRRHRQLLGVLQPRRRPALRARRRARRRRLRRRRRFRAGRLVRRRRVLLGGGPAGRRSPRRRGAASPLTVATSIKIKRLIKRGLVVSLQVRGGLQGRRHAQLQGQEARRRPQDPSQGGHGPGRGPDREEVAGESAAAPRQEADAAGQGHLQAQDDDADAQGEAQALRRKTGPSGRSANRPRLDPTSTGLRECLGRPLDRLGKEAVMNPGPPPPPHPARRRQPSLRSRSPRPRRAPTTPAPTPSPSGTQMRARRPSPPASRPVGPSPAEARIYAMTHIAIHDALNAIKRRSRPYAFRGRARRHASLDAAVATAARDVLVPTLGQLVCTVPQECADAAVASVEADYVAALDAIRDGRAKTRGVAVGGAAAQRSSPSGGGRRGRAAGRRAPTTTRARAWRVPLHARHAVRVRSALRRARRRSC